MSVSKLKRDLRELADRIIESSCVETKNRTGDKVEVFRHWKTSEHEEVVNDIDTLLSKLNNKEVTG